MVGPRQEIAPVSVPSNAAIADPRNSDVPSGAMDGKAFLESLRDGREVWLHGEKVKDVTTHPAFAGVTQTLAGLYDMQHAAETREKMTYVDEDGVRVSTSYLPPKTYDELIQRRVNTDTWA